MVEASDLPQDIAGENWPRAPVQQKESVITAYSACHLKVRKPIFYTVDSFLHASTQFNCFLSNHKNMKSQAPIFFLITVRYNVSKERQKKFASGTSHNFMQKVIPRDLLGIYHMLPLKLIRRVYFLK